MSDEISFPAKCGRGFVERYAARFNYDLDAIYRHLKEREQRAEGGATSVSLELGESESKLRVRPEVSNIWTGE